MSTAVEFVAPDPSGHEHGKDRRDYDRFADNRQTIDPLNTYRNESSPESTSSSNSAHDALVNKGLLPSLDIASKNASETKNPDGSRDVQLADGATVRYDQNGNVIMYANSDGTKMEYAYQNGFVVSVTDTQGTLWKRFADGQFYQVDDRGNARGEHVSGAKFIPPTTDSILYENARNGNFDALIYALLPGENIEPPIEPNDVRQGGLGDCYFLAPVAAIAAWEPELIQKMIADNRDGSYTVTFPGDSAHPVTVEAPTADELRRFAHEEDGMWVCLLEKAHRYYTGRMNSDLGGSSMEALELLTGEKYTRRYIENEHLNFDQVHQILEDGLAKGPLVAVSGSASPIVQNHAWSVLNFDGDSNMVTMRNPWGSLGFDASKIPGCTDLGQGQFSIPLDQFLKLFDRLAVRA